MQYYFNLALFLVGLLYCSQTVLAEVYTSIPIEPYDQQSIQTINQSMSTLKSDFSKVLNECVNLQTAIETNKAHPSELNVANLMEARGRMFSGCIEFTKNSNEALVKVVPELKKYKKFLAEYADKLEFEENPLYKESVKKMKEEAKILEQFASDLDEIRKYFKMIQEDFQRITTVWINGEQINIELAKCFGSQNIKSFSDDMSRVVKQLMEIRNMLIDSVKENTLGTPEEYHEGMGNLKRTFKDYLRGG